MSQMISKKTYGNVDKDILINKGTATIVNCIVSNTSVANNADGRKIIPAGTPIGSATSLTTNPNAVLSTTNSSSSGANTQGLLLNSVDVTDGNTNAQIVLRGTVDISKCPTFDATVLTALKGAFTFVNGGK